MKLTPEHLIGELIVVLAEALPAEIVGEPVELLPNFAVHEITCGSAKMTAVTFTVGDQMIELALRVRDRAPRGHRVTA